MDKYNEDMERAVAPLLRYLKHRESKASLQKEDELWAGISSRLKRRRKGVRMFAWAASVAAVAAGVMLFLFLPGREESGGQGMDVRWFAETTVPLSEHVELITSEGGKVKLDSGRTVAYAGDGSVAVDERKIHLEKAEEPQTVMHQIVVPKGKHIRLRLSDGSELNVNSGTRVAYPQTFRSDYREIYVEGEIFIDVARQANDAPFVVRTSSFDIRVLGTAFNVNAYKDDPQAEVVLVRGKVEVKDRQEETHLLMPSQLMRLDGGRYAGQEEVDVDRYICWVDGILSLDGRSLGWTLERLGDYFGREVVYDDAVSRMPMHGKLDLNEGLEKALETIAFTAPVSFEEQEGKYHVHVTK